MACIEGSVIREVVSVEASASCAEAGRVMARRGVGSVGVRRGGKLAGLVTERELVAEAARGADLDRVTVGEAMRVDQPTVSLRATDRECAQLMRARRTRHLAVSDGGEIVGIISMLDLVDLVVGEQQWDIDQLQSYIRGGRTHQLSEPITTIFQHAPALG